MRPAGLLPGWPTPVAETAYYAITTHIILVNRSIYAPHSTSSLHTFDKCSKCSGLKSSAITTYTDSSVSVLMIQSSHRSRSTWLKNAAAKRETGAPSIGKSEKMLDDTPLAVGTQTESGRLRH